MSVGKLKVKGPGDVAPGPSLCGLCPADYWLTFAPEHAAEEAGHSFSLHHISE